MQYSNKRLHNLLWFQLNLIYFQKWPWSNRSAPQFPSPCSIITSGSQAQFWSPNCQSTISYIALLVNDLFASICFYEPLPSSPFRILSDHWFIMWNRKLSWKKTDQEEKTIKHALEQSCLEHVESMRGDFETDIAAMWLSIFTIYLYS